MKYVAAAIVIILLAAGLWAQAAAPCWLWSLSPAKDVPARCLMEGK